MSNLSCMFVIGSISFNYHISVIFNGSNINTYYFIFSILLILFPIKRLFTLNKEFYHIISSTWLILNNVICQIFESFFISNFPVSSIGYFNLVGISTYLALGKGRKGCPFSELTMVCAIAHKTRY